MSEIPTFLEVLISAVLLLFVVQNSMSLYAAWLRVKAMQSVKKQAKEAAARFEKAVDELNYADAVGAPNVPQVTCDVCTERYNFIETKCPNCGSENN